MSLSLLAQAMHVAIPARSKLILILLADCADDFGEVQPAVSDLARMGCCSVEEAAQAMSEFGAIRLLSRVPGLRPGAPARYEIDRDLLMRLSVPGLWRRLVEDRGAA